MKVWREVVQVVEVGVWCWNCGVVSVVVAALGGGGILPCVLFVCLSEVGLEVDVCFVHWRLGSPFAARLGKKWCCFDECNARSDLARIGDSIISQDRKGLTILQLGEEILDGGWGCHGVLIFSRFAAS